MQINTSVILVIRMCSSLFLFCLSWFIRGERRNGIYSSHRGKPEGKIQNQKYGIRSGEKKVFVNVCIVVIVFLVVLVVVDGVVANS